MKTPKRLFLATSMALIFGFGLCTNAALCQSPTAPPAVVNKTSILHVSRSSLAPGTAFVMIWGTIDGAKIQLMAVNASSRFWTVPPGDYPVRMTHDEKGEHGISREYEVDLVPGKHQKCFLAGMEE